MSSPAPRPPLRLWPAGLIAIIATVAITVVRLRESLTFQQRNMTTGGLLLGTLVLLLLWWVLFSRAPARLRVAVTASVLGALVLGVSLFRIRGVSGDLVPILEFRWAAARPVPAAPSAPPTAAAPAAGAPSGPAVASGPAAPLSRLAARPDFPHFLGPARTAVLAGPALSPDWAARPPELLWRTPVGPGWSGFAIVGDRALTQEQAGEEERVTCRDLRTGAVLWTHADTTRYANPIGGEGPRATPTVADSRVFTLGSNGRLNALDLATGRRLWTHDLPGETRATIPEWGYAGSPLVLDGRVIVSAGGPAGQSLLAFRADTGARVWSGGDAEAGYGSPFPATLAGRPQLLLFNHRRISAHDPADGSVLWEYPWGRGFPHVAVPVVAGPDRVLFSSGYGVGSELLEIKPAPSAAPSAAGTAAPLAANRLWHSMKLKAKFSNPVLRDGHVYGLDDGILACLDLRDGSVRWREGRHGHGQALLVGDLLLLMAESGELIVFRPTPAGPGELHRFRVFDSKTWNPLALAGDLLLVRNDREAAALRLPLAP